MGGRIPLFSPVPSLTADAEKSVIIQGDGSFIVSNSQNSNNRVLRLNVGFLLKQGAGYSREITFEQPGTIKADDFLITDLDGSLRLSRTPQGVLVQGALHAKSLVECVRCLTPFALPYDVEISELFVPEELARQREIDPAEASTITEEGYIDLTPIVREEGILALPIQPLCSATCKGLCPECGQNLNEGTCDCEVEQIDPRLEPLRALLKDLED